MVCANHFEETAISHEICKFQIYKRTKTNSHGNVLKRSMNLHCNQQAHSYVYLKTPGRTHSKKNYIF